MSDKATVIKEAKAFLEDAQKEVLKALNSEASFLSRLFSGSGARNNLQIAQSSLSKAINQMKSLREDDNSGVAKLQKHLSERDDKIKKLESELESRETESSNLKDQIRQFEAKIEDFRTQEEKEEPKTSTENEAASSNPYNKSDENLKDTILKLEDKNKFLSEKLDQNQKELTNSNDLVLEFSARMKRLKSEITTK